MKNKMLYIDKFFNCLPQILSAFSKCSILLLTGNTSFLQYKTVFEEILKNFKYTHYNDFTPNPNIEDIKKALNAIKNNYNIIIAIGGGSVIDFAKLLKYYNRNSHSIKIIAIPTTAGTGAEATKFAVLYVNGEKTSIEDLSLLPDFIILDYELVRYAPRYLKACSALDTFCQGIESFWSNKSTTVSLNYAEKSIILSRNNIEKFVNSDDIEAASNMLHAANFSGKAINISKTTAAHAVSYQLTSKYKIPHGHAVALSIVNNFIYNQNINSKNINDKRGQFFVKNQMEKLQKMLKIDDPIIYFKKLFENIGICINHTKLGITDIKSIIKNVNYKRLINNPKKLSYKELNNIIINSEF